MLWKYLRVVSEVGERKLGGGGWLGWLEEFPGKDSSKNFSSYFW